MLGEVMRGDEGGGWVGEEQAHARSCPAAGDSTPLRECIPHRLKTNPPVFPALYMQHFGQSVQGQHAGPTRGEGEGGDGIIGWWWWWEGVAADGGGEGGGAGGGVAGDGEGRDGGGGGRSGRGGGRRWTSDDQPCAA